MDSHDTGLEIAVIGMSGKFPGADDLEQYWELLMRGESSVSYFSEEELIAGGIPEQSVRNPNYVRAKPFIQNVYDFDASLFGYAPWEVQSMDPQTRLFHECVYHALENSGYHPDRYDGTIGMYAGASLDIQWTNKHLSRNNSGDQGILETGVLSSKDFLSQLISYKLNLTGPSYTLYTACSTSLAAIHLACQGLLLGDCNLALAGGVTLEQPSLTGYLYEDGKINSSSGVCRPFDNRADGTVFGEGAGAVVLKRLSDAVQDGDYIYAVIKGSSSNNDGRRKVGFFAPSLEGQKEVIRSAWDFANIDPSTIEYIEAHGTGTKVGDPIEFEALKQAFGSQDDNVLLGSVKGNIGHLHAAAGIAGFIKVVLSLEREVLPPTVNYTEPNPLLKIKQSHFSVNQQSVPWKRKNVPRRAGLSSFGVGGTNVHLVLEEAPPRPESLSVKGSVIMPFSAKSASSLKCILKDMAAYFHQNSHINMADAAYTLQVGRGQFNYRAVCIADQAEAAARSLIVMAEGAAIDKSVEERLNSSIVFMFTGQGSQYAGMGAELYQQYSKFRQELDRLAEKLIPHLKTDIRLYLCHRTGDCAANGIDLEQLHQTWLAQPALFALEYALAQTWISLGIKPTLMVGHSIGEYVAATIAGVFSLEDALDLVVTRGRLMQSTSAGTMLAAAVPASEAPLYTSDLISLAAINRPNWCVFSGSKIELAHCKEEWESKGIFAHWLNTSHAFHSFMMDEIVEPFKEVLRSKQLHPPQASFFSCLTGELIHEDMAVNPDYWAAQLRGTVHFSEIAATCLADEHCIMLEMGPGKTLCNLVKSQASGERIVLSSLGAREREHASFLDTVSCLWIKGVAVKWELLSFGLDRRRLPLPMYHFDRQTYIPLAGAKDHLPVSQNNLDNAYEFLYQPIWKPTPLSYGGKINRKLPLKWLVFHDGDMLEPCINGLLEAGDSCICVTISARYHRDERGRYAINPNFVDHFHKLADDLKTEGIVIDCILHGWCLEEGPNFYGKTGAAATVTERGYPALIHLISALANKVLSEETQIFVAATGIFDIYGSQGARPERRFIMGPLLAMLYEYPRFQCKLIDLGLITRKNLITSLFREITTSTGDNVIVYRGMMRLVQHFEPVMSDNSEIVFEKEEAEEDQRQVYLFISSSDDKSVEKFIHTRGNAHIIHSAAGCMDEIERAVKAAACLTGRIDGVIYDPLQPPLELRTLSELSNSLSPNVVDMTSFERLNQCLLSCGADIGFGWIMSSLASVVGGYGLCELSARASAYDAAAEDMSLTTIPWMSLSRDFIRKDTYAVSGITEEQAVAIYERLWPFRNQMNRVVISALPPKKRVVVVSAFQSEESGLSESYDSSSIYSERSVNLGDCIYPSTEAEKILCELVAEQLGVSPVGIEDHFYDLGGHSLLLTRLLSRIKDIFRVELKLSIMLETPTVSAILRVLMNEWGSYEVLEEIATTYRQYQKLVNEEIKMTSS